MPSRNPSFITKSRHGIWYFQLWVPKSVKTALKTDQQLIRKSLRTRNRAEALKRAREWWTLMNSEKTLSMQEFLKQEEEFIESERRKYDLGATVAAEIERLGIDPNNRFEIESFFECMPPDRESSYYFYLDYLEQLEKAKQSRSITTSQPEESSLVHSNNPLISDLLVNWQKVMKEEMAPSSYLEYERMTNLFLKVIAEFNSGESPTVMEVNEEMIRDYRDTVSNLPKYVKTTDKNIHNLAKISGPKKGKVTLKNNIRNVGTFLKWVYSEGYPLNENVLRILTARTKIKSSEKKKRVPFSNSDLIKIFHSHRYQFGKFTRACDYWAPLIALFTGGTQGEIVQLYVSDIRKKSGIFVFDINDTEDKQLKTEDGRPRLVPVHPQLIKLGFLEFVEFQKGKRFKKLFHNESRDVRNLYGAYSKRFRYFRDKVGAGPRSDDEFRDFHSFRHLVRTKLTEASVDEFLIDDIIGHASDSRSTGRKTYTHAALVEQKNEAIKKLNYDLDFSKIAYWKRCKFMR